MSQSSNIFASVFSVIWFRVPGRRWGAAAAAVPAEGQDVWFCSASANSPQCTGGAWGTASEKRAKSNDVTLRGREQRWCFWSATAHYRNSFETTRATKTFPAGKSLVVKRERRSMRRRHGLTYFIVTITKRPDLTNHKRGIAMLLVLYAVYKHALRAII